MISRAQWLWQEEVGSEKVLQKNVQERSVSAYKEILGGC